MLYFIALYYKKNIFSGANKRFDSMGEILVHKYGDKFKIIIIEGEKPSWIKEENCYFLPKYSNFWQRIKTFFSLSSTLKKIPAGTVVSDFMPIPFNALKKHQHYQLIYDLRNFTEFKRGGLSFFTALFQQYQLKKSNKIITISEFSKKDIIENCSIDEDKIIVSYCGIEEHYINFNENKIRENDLLYVATYEKRKNHAGLMKAISENLDNLKVVFVGQDHGLMAEIKDMAEKISKEKNIKFTFIEKISEEGLIELYRNTSVYVFPSFIEGFGMPLIEAMANDCKVVCSNIEVFKEVCNNNALYFDPNNSASISAAIDASLASSPTNNNSIYSKKFLWKNITDLFLDEIKT